MAFHLSAQSPSVFAASEHAALSHDNRLGVERWWEGKPAACRIPGQRGTRPCDVENHLLSPHLHGLQPHLHGTSSAELCLPAQPFPHGFPTALGHSNPNESAIFNSLESLTTAAGFCYHFISIYWMGEKIAQFWIGDEMRGRERKREPGSTCEI